MSVNRDGTMYATLYSGEYIQLGIPANNNLPVKEIEASIKAHTDDLKSGKCRRLKSNVWVGFEEAQLKAARKIESGFHMLFGGGGLRAQSFDGMPRAGSYSECNSSDLDDAFSRWAKQVFDEGVSVSAALDVIVFGKSFRKVDQAHCKRKGYAKDNLMKCLDMYIQT